jgi:hypothetical protein
VLDFGKDKEMRAKAKGLDGKKVLVEGVAILQYTHTVTAEPADRTDERRRSKKAVSVLDLGPKVAVKSLVAAPREQVGCVPAEPSLLPTKHANSGSS